MTDQGDAVDPSFALRPLRMQWAGLVIFSLALFVLFGAFLALWWAPTYVVRWGLLAGFGLIYLLWSVGRSLKLNYRRSETVLLPTLGLGNLVTAFRGVLVAMLVGFLVIPGMQTWQAWVPGILYTGAALLDYVDGYLARSRNQSTRLGELLDLNVDGIGVLAATLLVVLYGQAPIWYLLVGLARYLFIAGIWLRQKLGRPVYALPPSWSRRALAGVQMSFLFVILWPIFSPPATHVAAALFSIPFLIGFTRDWFYVSGVFQQATSDKSQKTKIELWLPIGLRLGVVLLISGGLISRFSGPWQTNLSVVSLTLSAAELLVLLLIGLGAAGRSAAIVGLGVLGFSQIQSGLTLQHWLLMGLYTALLYMGSGAFSLWKPEEKLLYRRAGEA